MKPKFIAEIARSKANMSSLLRLQNGYDIRTVQELLGYKDVTTTMIYTHVLNRGTKGVRSPLVRSTAVQNRQNRSQLGSIASRLRAKDN